MLHADHELVDRAGRGHEVIARQRRPVRQVDGRDAGEHLIGNDLAVVQRPPHPLHVIGQIRGDQLRLTERGANFGIRYDLDPVIGQAEPRYRLEKQHQPIGPFGQSRRDIAAGAAAHEHHRVRPVELEPGERALHVGGAAQGLEHESADHHIHERDRILRRRAVEEIIVHAGGGEAVSVPERVDVVQRSAAGIVDQGADLRLVGAPGRLVQLIEPVVGSAPIERAHLRGVRAQRGEARLPARVAVRLDLRQVGKRGPDMADRSQLIEPAGAIGPKPILTQPRAARPLIDVDVGAHDQHQWPGRSARGLRGDDGLREHLTQGGLPGGIARLPAAGEVEEQVHELGRRGIAAGGLSRRRRGEKQQRERHEAEKANFSHAGHSIRCAAGPYGKAGGRVSGCLISVSAVIPRRTPAGTCCAAAEVDWRRRRRRRLSLQGLVT